MPNFVSIKEAKTRVKGNIRFTVISIGELTSGHTKSGDEWQKQIVKIHDNSGKMNLTLWNETTGIILDGKSYSLENAYWTEYNDEPQLSLGKYYKLNEIPQLTLYTLVEKAADAPTNLSPNNSPQEEFQNITQNEMIARIYDMTKEMYHDFVDRKC